MGEKPNTQILSLVIKARFPQNGPRGTEHVQTLSDFKINMQIRGSFFFTIQVNIHDKVNTKCVIN